MLTYGINSSIVGFFPTQQGKLLTIVSIKNNNLQGNQHIIELVADST